MLLSRRFKKPMIGSWSSFVKVALTLTTLSGIFILLNLSEIFPCELLSCSLGALLEQVITLKRRVSKSNIFNKTFRMPPLQKTKSIF